MSVRFGLTAATFLGATVLLWTACRSSSYPLSPESNPDASDDQSLHEEATPLPPDCNPCLQVCACTPGDTFFATGSCMTYTCVSGTWGAFDCLGLGCDEAGDAPFEVGSEASAGDSGDSSLADAGDASFADTGDASPVEAAADAPVD